MFYHFFLFFDLQLLSLLWAVSKAQQFDPGWLVPQTDGHYAEINEILFKDLTFLSGEKSFLKKMCLNDKKMNFISNNNQRRKPNAG